MKEKKYHHSNQFEKNPRDEAELNNKIQEFQDYLDDFVADLEQDYLEFSPELNSHERFLVHEENWPPKASDKVCCKHCNKDVIKANISLHEIHCARQQKDRARSAQGIKTDSCHKNVNKKTQNPNSAVVSRLQKIDNDDFDALINAAQKIDRSCSFKKCKTKISTLGQVCEFCQGVYCLTHHMPEIHGCGEAAKAQARTTIKGGVLYRGSGLPDRLPDADRKAHLQKKLDKKLTDMSAQRNRKKPKK
ncbi:hypothetical protein KUTeg_024671 [Tegillarca granosa]|uniref:AN1-type domain-containing protein n=1 Tax=Tegillarca granosa TaxID=220873 RepID=A0ABQ9E3P0_TEGGR|nr:hypothetical protein KUTeg_024671 [Tegillarca granosa]